MPGAIVNPAGFGFALPPGVGLDVDLRGGIEPERAPRDGRDQKQDGCDEQAPKRAPARRRERDIGHAAIPLTGNFVNKADAREHDPEKHALGYDPMGEDRFSLATNAERVCAEIMLEQKDRAG